LSDSNSIGLGNLSLNPKRRSTLSIIRSRMSELLMLPVVATQEIASRSQQSRVKAILTRSPLPQAISNPSEHHRALSHGNYAAAGVSASRVLQAVPTGGKLLQGSSQGGFPTPRDRNDHHRVGQGFTNANPLRECGWIMAHGGAI
jgi:hypothetical protein